MKGDKSGRKGQLSVATEVKINRNIPVKFGFRVCNINTGI